LLPHALYQCLIHLALQLVATLDGPPQQDIGAIADPLLDLLEGDARQSAALERRIHRPVQLRHAIDQVPSRSNSSKSMSARLFSAMDFGQLGPHIWAITAW
jgi:hypothetical protein